MTDECTLSVNNKSLVPSGSQTATSSAHCKGLRGFMDTVFEGKYFMRNKSEKISVQQQNLRSDKGSTKMLHIDNENSGRTEPKLTTTTSLAVHEPVQKYHGKITDELIRASKERKNKMNEISEIPAKRPHSARPDKSKAVDTNYGNKTMTHSSRQSSPTVLRIQNKRSVRNVKKSSQSSSSQAKTHLLRGFSFRNKGTSVHCQKNVLSPLLLSSYNQKQRVDAMEHKMNSSFEDSSALTKVSDGHENDKRDIKLAEVNVHKSSGMFDQTMEGSFNEVSIDHALQQIGISSVSDERNSDRNVTKRNETISKVMSYSPKTVSNCRALNNRAEDRDDKTPILAAVTSSCTNTTTSSISNSFQQHRVRSLIRCSRQTQRYQMQQNHPQSVEVINPATPFKRGFVHLRDSRRRIAEKMHLRKSQPNIADSLEKATHQKASQQLSDHSATRVKFLNENKPTVMNKWIRIAKTTSAYGNLAFERSGNLVKHDCVEENKSCCYADIDLVDNDYDDDNKTESDQAKLHSREAYSARVRAKDSPISSNQQHGNNLGNTHQKADICVYTTNQKVLDGLPYVDSDETEYLNDEENSFGKKMKISNSKFTYDQCCQPNGFLIGQILQELHMNRQFLNNNRASLSLVKSDSDIPDERERNMISSSIGSFSDKTAPSPNKPKSVKRICTNPNDRSVCGTVKEELQFISEVGTRSSAWFNKQNHLSEVITANVPVCSELHKCGKDEVCS
ncbi:unnamed protein product [Anisakis simplex]|uniref:Non-specific serine/threonine protein kinase n=1 Tax=Anisakis simplex TaxID=6269 RepID=A0A0M3JWL4_ANISI|nr:unnamed protein product [Anisakis simplex]